MANEKNTTKSTAITMYTDFIRSYARNRDGSCVNPSLHDSTAAQHEPMIVH